nr:TIGR02466 family protein [Sphingobium sp. YR768]
MTKLFPTPLVSVVHPDASRLSAALKAAILDRESSHPGVSHSNEGGWQSSDDLLVWTCEAGQQLIDFATELANMLSAVWHPERGLLEADLAWTFNAWANVNRTGHGNAQHAHPGAYWSAVYWVDDGMAGHEGDLGGELEFADPRGSVATMLSSELKMKVEGCLDAGLAHRISPRTGKLVMFPSWLLHSVRRFTGAGPRVSIAINFVPPGR